MSAPTLDISPRNLWRTSFVPPKISGGLPTSEFRARTGRTRSATGAELDNSVLTSEARVTTVDAYLDDSVPIYVALNPAFG